MNKGGDNTPTRRETQERGHIDMIWTQRELTIGGLALLFAINALPNAHQLQQ